MAEKKATPKGAAKAVAKTEDVTKQPASGKRAAGSDSAATAATKAKTKVAQKVQNPFTAARPRSTWMPEGKKVDRKWFVVDADGLVLGRAASRIAMILRGKHKPTYTQHADMGDFVVVVNAEKIKLTGNKEGQKPYYHHTMHPGGLKTIIAKDVRVRDPERLIQDAVRRMIARNPLGRDMMGKLHVYKGPTHPHAAQKPEPLTLSYK